MKQFIDKLIERLEEKQNDIIGNLSLNNYYSDGYDKGIEYAIEIVNQLAEEYINCSTDTSTDFAIVQSLPSLYPLQAFEEEAIHRVVEMAKSSNIQTIDVSELLGEQVNDGWISVEDKLPELTEGTECFKQSKCCLTTLRWWDGDMTESVGWYNQSGVWNEDSKNCKVVAWMPLPPKYQPKGQAND